jgi:hypothetical protein
MTIEATAGEMCEVWPEMASPDCATPHFYNRLGITDRRRKIVQIRPVLEA